MSDQTSVYQAYQGNTYLFGGNAPYVEEMYENYLANPGSVPDSWREYFDALQHVPAVDGTDAKDFDDAVFARRTPKGWRLWVAIADVSRYVLPGTALDREAQARATSVYFPGRVIPMLPPVLSDDLCSLRPDEDRYALIAELVISAEGQMRSSRF